MLLQVAGKFQFLPVAFSPNFKYNHHTHNSLFTLISIISPSSMDDHSVLQLPSSVEQLIAEICAKRQLPPLKTPARMELSLLGEEVSLDVLRTIASGEIKYSFDGFVKCLAGKRKSPKRFSNSPPSSLQPIRSPVTPPTSARLMIYHQCTLTYLFFFFFFCFATVLKCSCVLLVIDESDFLSPVRKQLDRAAVNWPGITPELEALGELEFRKQFLILSYLGG